MIALNAAAVSLNKVVPQGTGELAIEMRDYSQANGGGGSEQ